MKVIGAAVITVTGFTTTPSGDYQIKGGPEEFDHFIDKTLEAGVLVVGSKTFDGIPEKNRFREGRFMVVFVQDKNKKVNIPNKLLWWSRDQTPEDLLEALGNMGYTQVVIAGGSQIYKLFFEHDLIDEFFVTIMPVFTAKGTPFIALSDLQRSATLLSSKIVDEDSLLLHYKFNK